MAHSVLPYDRLLSIDERLEDAAAKPVIIPDTIVIDHGSVFVSAQLPGGLPASGYQHPARPPGQRRRETPHREVLRLGGLAV